MNELRERLHRAGALLPPPEDPFERLVRRRDRKRRMARFTAGVVAMTLAVGVLGGAMWALLRTSGTEGRTGIGSGGPTGLALEPGQYSYIKTTVDVGGDQAIWETWWAPDGSGRINVLAEPTNYGPPESGIFGPGEFPVESDVSGLSTDPVELAEEIRARSAPGGASPQPDVTPGPGQSPETGGLWRAVQRLLEYPNAAPDLRAAIFEVAAGIPGVQTVEDATDPVGRDAVALELTAEGADWRLFFDPATHQLMAMQSTSAWGDFYEILEVGIVRSTEATPDGDEYLFPPLVEDLPGSARSTGPSARSTDPAA